MTMVRGSIIIACSAIGALSASAQATLVRDTISSGGRVREYYFAAADTAATGMPLPSSASTAYGTSS